MYTYDSILSGRDQNEINEIIKYIKKKNLDITVEGYLPDFIGVNIAKNIDGTITLSQPHMIDQILKDFMMD